MELSNWQRPSVDCHSEMHFVPPMRGTKSNPAGIIGPAPSVGLPQTPRWNLGEAGPGPGQAYGVGDPASRLPQFDRDFPSLWPEPRTVGPPTRCQQTENFPSLTASASKSKLSKSEQPGRDAWPRL